MDSFRLVQCVVSACGQVFFLCPDHDRGHIYCDDCRPVARPAVRKRSRRRYWRSFKGRLKTAARVSRHRREQNVTHARRREVGLSSTVTAPSAPLVMETTTTGGVESTDGIDLDGNRPERHEHEGARDGRASRHDLEGEAVALARAPTRDGHAARGHRALAGPVDPRCAVCGRTARWVRLEPLSRDVHRRRWSSLHARLDPRSGARTPRAPP